MLSSSNSSNAGIKAVKPRTYVCEHASMCKYIDSTDIYTWRDIKKVQFKKFEPMIAVARAGF